MVTDQDLFCKEEQRRADLLANPDLPLLNGIDYVEVDPADHKIIYVHFLKPVPPANAGDPNDDAYGISADVKKITISGGTRVVGIKSTSAKRGPDERTLTVTVDQPGDYSVYALTIDDVPELDIRLRRVAFSFMASCPVDFDCPQEVDCPPPDLEEPALDYLAKDYASFRRLMLDLLPQLNPQYTERNPADLGIALIELLAYRADRLSYFQDSVANEAYLDTLRQRISARRHARLIDYRMHDGRNAWTYVQLTVTGAGNLLPACTKVLTRIAGPLEGDTAPPKAWVDESKITVDALEKDPALASTEVFETTHNANLDSKNNRIFIHAWGDEECCLPPDTTEAFLYSVEKGENEAKRPVLKKGDHLLLEEVKGPRSGLAADADPSRRQVVRIDEDPEDVEDPLYSDTMVQDTLQRWQLGEKPLPLVRVHWRREDALRFSLCLSTVQPDIGLLNNVSLARGNVVLADHGHTFVKEISRDTPVPEEPPFRLHLSRGPLTMQCESTGMEDHPETNAWCATSRFQLDCDVREARPAVGLLVTSPTGTEVWKPVSHLFDSNSFDRHFVAEVDNQGRAVLRFPDPGEGYGQPVIGATSFQVRYRIGNGRAGNVGAEALAHIAFAPNSWILSVRNPLPAQGGVDMETIEEVRENAPEAFRAEQFRAVTESDYAAAARKPPEVAGAVANFRWTGSWYTVFVGVDPRDPDDIINRPAGGTRLSQTLETVVRPFISRYRLAGYDYAIRPPTFVPLEVDLEVCAASGHFRIEVAAAVAQALSSRVLPDGRRGFFHPDNFTFGQPVYASRIYAAVEKVEGVDSVVITKLRHFDQPDNGELASGVLPIAPGEIAQLENDPNFMEHGVLRITALGGKG